MSRSLHRTLLVGLLLGAGLGSRSAAAAVTDPAFTESLVASKVGVPTGMAWAPDGSSRLFVTSKIGDVWIIEDGKLLPQPFVSVSPIQTTSECGLLGIVFDPDFLTNRYVYFFVSVSASEQQIIRYTDDGNNVGVDKTIILGGLPTLGNNHDGGGLAFGPDAKLYFSVGDNGARLGVGSDLSLLNSKVGRANADGSVPADNPFVDGDGPNNDYVWARGFRNPFTMTFQPSTGQLWLNVVGTDWEQIFRPRAGDHGGWNAFESNQPPGYLAPAVSYAVDISETHSIRASGAVRLGGTSTVYTSDAHRYRPGTRVTIAGVSDTTFNGTYVISETLSATQLSYQQLGPDAVSGSGTVASEVLGGCVVGGTFWDASSVPSEYQGNFLFGDFNSGRILRAVLGADDQVARVDVWATGANKVVDVVTGFDGDLYYATNNGNVRRIGYTPTVQALVVSQLNVRMVEGGKAALSVRLATPPPANRTVLATKLGTGDVAVTEGASLTFTAANWSTPQRIVLSAGVDADSVEDLAFVRVASSGLAVEDVTVRVTEAQASYVVLTPGALELPEAAAAEVNIALSQPPTGPLTVTLAPQSAKVTASPSELTFTAKDWATPQPVTISALADDDAEDESTGVLVAARGLRTQQLAVSVRDDDESSGGGAGAPMTAEAGAPPQAVGGAPQIGGAAQVEAGASGEVAGAFTAEGGQGGVPAGATGGALTDVGGEATAPSAAGGDQGCGCRMRGGSRPSSFLVIAGAVGLWGLVERRRRRAISASDAGRTRRHPPRSDPR